MSLRKALGADVDRVHEQVDALLDSEDAMIVLVDGSRAISYGQGFGISPSQLELLALEIERAIRIHRRPHASSGTDCRAIRLAQGATETEAGSSKAQQIGSGVGGIVFHHKATSEYRQHALDVLQRATATAEVLGAEAESHASQQRLAAERALDAVLADSFPASDPPSWTLGVRRSAQETGATSDGDATPDVENWRE